MNYYPNRGRLRGIYQLRGHIEDDKEHYIQRIKPLFEQIYNVKINLREMPSTRVFGFQIWNDAIVNFKRTLGLPLGKKYELSIPKQFVASKELLAACIRGIFDTDGCLYLEKKNGKLYPRIQIVTISSDFATQLKSTLIDLGFRATMHSELNNQDYNRLRAFTIALRGEEMATKFMKEIKPQNGKHIKKYNRFLMEKPKT